jgi:hypothetical protein
LDELTHRILKYEKDDAAELMTAIKNMMIRLKNVQRHGKKAKL